MVIDPGKGHVGRGRAYVSIVFLNSAEVMSANWLMPTV